MAEAIEIDGVGKRFRLDEGFDAYDTLRESLTRSLRRGLRTRQADERWLWALRDVSLTVEEGEIVGVIGRNGAGKTTLLRIVARITAPTLGVSRTRGRVGSLLDVGTGFHPELTGRENVFLNGAVLGMSRAEVRRRFDEIVAFAGLERFLDTPVKRYSSGMYLRLAFSVAAHLEPEIVVVDEVLAVGDAEFQQRCLGKMGELERSGRTVVFVSHDLGALNRLCDRVVWLEEGRVRRDGIAVDVIEAYLSGITPTVTERLFAADGNERVHLLSVAITDPSGEPLTSVHRDQPFCIKIVVDAFEPLPSLDVAIYVLWNQLRVLEEAWSDTTDQRSVARPGRYEVVIDIPPVFAAGDFVLGVWAGTEFETFFEEEVFRIELRPRPNDRTEHVERNRVVSPPVVWRVKELVRDG